MESVVYIRVDPLNRIFAVDSSYNLSDTSGWIEIDRGVGRKYKNAQVEYFDKPLYDDRLICRYKFKNNKVMERTKEEMDADNVSDEPADVYDQRISTLESALKAIEEGINSV